MNAIDFAEKGLAPTWLIRLGIRSLVKKRLQSEQAQANERKQRLIEELKSSPVAIETEAANEQHYEVPAEFFQSALGPRLKYSCGYWPEGVNTLAESEEASLQQVAERARIEDGMSILELGCGWGSFTLWAAARFPQSKLKAVSNSSSQKAFIMARAEERGLGNIEIATEDMNRLQLDDTFDRIVSIEMLEHMRNYKSLFQEISSWLKPEGKFFAHVFSHREFAYTFEDKEQGDWMARNFFTGGIMPSRDLLPRFDEALALVEQWHLNGTHYQKTAEAWLSNIDRNKKAVLKALGECYGPESAALWKQRWRLFMLACAELFGYQGGQEWGVSHYLFKKRQ